MPHRPAIAAAAVVVCLLGSSGRAMAQQSVSVNLAGVQIRHATNQSRSSAPATLAPAPRYRIEISGAVSGQPLFSPMWLLFPNPVPLAQAMETLSPGSSALLRSEASNPAGTHPFAVTDIMLEDSTEVGGVTVSFAATLNAGIDASNHASFNIQDVTISPSSIGYLSFSTGSVVITRIPCPANFDGQGAPGEVNSNDISAFLSAWLAGVGGVGGSADRGDYDLDGVVNSNDISAFLADWLSTVATGCPE